MPSFLRSGAVGMNRRRYDLTVDSWYLTLDGTCRIEMETDITTDENNNTDSPPATDPLITYYTSFAYLASGRPRSSRLEMEIQMTVRLLFKPDLQTVQTLNILLTIQLLCRLTQRSHDDPGVLLSNYPLLQYRQKTAKCFIGASVTHLVFQQVYSALSGRSLYGKYMI